MIGVPAAGAVTTALLVLAGLGVVAAAAFAVRRRVGGWGLETRVVAVAAGLSLAALPWIAWRFAEDLATTTRYDAYTRANAGPIQAYLPGYLADGARARIPPGATWAVAVGSSQANPVAQKAFPALVLITLFPRPSAPPGTASWIVGWGAPPASIVPVSRAVVVHPRQGPLPPVTVAKTRR